MNPSNSMNDKLIRDFPEALTNSSDPLLIFLKLFFVGPL